MAKIPFAYAPCPIAACEPHPNGRTAHRTLAIATITATNGESFRCIVLPDSGADACIFPLSIAIILKLDVLNLPKAMTAGVGSQTNVTYYDNLTIDLGSGIKFTAYVGFSQAMESVGMGLLGQDGFFDSFNVEFRHSEKVFTVEIA